MLVFVRRMSARKAINAGAAHHLTVEGRETRLTLSPDSVVLSRNGIEFRSAEPFSVWKEMTLTLQSPHGEGRVHCSGVVIACTGNKHSGYHVALVFTGMSKQAEMRLTSMVMLNSL